MRGTTLTSVRGSTLARSMMATTGEQQALSVMAEYAFVSPPLVELVPPLQHLLTGAQ